MRLLSFAETVQLLRYASRNLQTIECDRAANCHFHGPFRVSWPGPKLAEYPRTPRSKKLPPPHPTGGAPNPGRARSAPRLGRWRWDFFVRRRRIFRSFGRPGNPKRRVVPQKENYLCHPSHPLVPRSRLEQNLAPVATLVPSECK
jgi:hypothetical protein